TIASTIGDLKPPQQPSPESSSSSRQNNSENKLVVEKRASSINDVLGSSHSSIPVAGGYRSPSRPLSRSSSKQLNSSSKEASPTDSADVNRPRKMLGRRNSSEGRSSPFQHGRGFFDLSAPLSSSPNIMPKDIKDQNLLEVIGGQ
ncbi:unnamed protein product, partial [Amoebophrya sp. A25]